MFIHSAPIISETVSAAAVLILLFAFPAVLFPFFLRKKPILRVFALLPLFFLLPQMTVYAVDFGTCGDYCTWDFDNNTVTLTVSGTGAMADYGPEYRPWNDHIYNIRRVVIQSGVTFIGMSAFKECPSLTIVTIPASVTSIGMSAFKDCPSLTTVTIPASVTSIGEKAFGGCGHLESVTIQRDSEDLYLGSYAFNGIPASAASLEYTGQDTNKAFFVNGGGYKIDNNIDNRILNLGTGEATLSVVDSYPVELDQQGGSNGTASVTAIYGSEMTRINVPTREGYTFGGYFTETNGGGTQYYNANGSSAKNWTETEVDTLYALWEKIPPKPLSDPSVTARLIPGSSFPYTGEPCRVGVEVRDGDKVLTEGVDYEITADSVLSAVEVGTYEVTVSADDKVAADTDGKAAKAVTGGDYTGSVTLTWRITSGNTPEHPGIDFFRLHADCELPATGFSSLRPTVLPEQPKDLRYEPVRMHLMLPTLDRDIELVTMPREGNSWAAAWLGADAGILEGSALPGEGLSIIAAHNTLNDTDYGPFALLSTLEVNDTVMVREESGALKLFRVYANELLEPDDMELLSALAGDDALVLLTCENESPAGTYLHRRAIFAK